MGILNRWSALGKLFGYCTLSASKFVRARLRLVKYVVYGGAVIVGIPPLLQYWVSRIHVTEVPKVPVSAIVALAVATAFMLAFGGTMYIVIQALMGISSQVVARQASPGYYSPGAVKPKATGGSFIPPNDMDVAVREKLDELKKKGILLGTDMNMSLEDLAREIGMSQMEKTRGVTEK